MRDALLLYGIDAILAIGLREESEFELVAPPGLVLKENDLSLISDDARNHLVALRSVKSTKRFDAPKA